jgi:hypothetical protein
MFRHLLVLAAGLTLFACGNGDGITPPITIDPEGTWSGTFQADSQDVSLTLQLTETSGAVTGNGTLVTSAGSFALTIDGSYTKPRLSLGITTPGFDPVSLVAIVGDTAMTGTIGGGGFKNESFTLDKQ